MEWSISFNLYFFPSIIFLRHKSRCHPETLESDPETLESDPETLESDPETLESVKRQAERPQGHIVQVKWITLAAQNEQVTQYPEQHLEDRTVALDKFESSESRPFISRLVVNVVVSQWLCITLTSQPNQTSAPAWGLRLCVANNHGGDYSLK